MKDKNKTFSLGEVHNDYVDEGFYHIDVFPVSEEEGKTVAAVCQDTGKVLFMDNGFRNNQAVLEAIADVKNKKVIDAPNGLLSWVETHHEIVSRINFEILSDNRVSDKMLDVVRKEGRTALYPIGIQWANEFEKKFAGETWVDKEWFDELDKFLEEKLK